MMRDLDRRQLHRPVRHTSIAQWFDHVQAVECRPQMQDWLSNRDSLTARLVACCGHFRVQRLSQHKAVCLQDEYAEVGLARRSKVVEREVLLRCDGEAMIYGHTIVPLQANASQWPLFQTLGERSLGTTLFNDHQVRRGALSYARLHASHPLMQRLRRILPDMQASATLPARRSLFWRQGACLLVTEVFLPAIGSLTPKEK
ncbi:chorismate--pyruvate lyase family protein [Undibacterium sp. SXout7W]|uniref:chorismate--pyruvate lyase family protein n=1 Tax=Undibacterium sp. SXout7W TaxID=3413049 RepID=UPI003BF3A8EA